MGQDETASSIQTELTHICRACGDLFSEFSLVPSIVDPVTVSARNEQGLSLIFTHETVQGMGVRQAEVWTFVGCSVRVRFAGGDELYALSDIATYEEHRSGNKEFYFHKDHLELMRHEPRTRWHSANKVLLDRYLVPLLREWSPQWLAEFRAYLSKTHPWL